VIVKSVKGEEDVRELQMHLVKKDEKEGLLYATVYEPNKIDKQNQTANAQEVKKMAHNLLKKGKASIDINHNLQKSECSLAESFILRGSDPMFEGIAKGSHCVVIELSEELKKSADSITGISLYGHATIRKDDAPPMPEGGDADPDGDGESLKRMRVEAGVGDVDMAQTLGLSHDDYVAFENGEADIDWNEELITAAAKKLKMTPAAFAATLLNGDDPGETNAGENVEDGQTQDPAEPAPTGPAAKSLSIANNGKTPTQKTTMPTQRRILKATEPTTIKVGSGANDREPIKKSYEDRMRIIGKAYLSMVKPLLLAKGIMSEDQFASKDDLISKGLFTPGDFDPAGTLQPALAREIFDVTVDRSAFLKRIQTVQMNSIEQNVAVADIGERTMTRLTAAGSPGATVDPTKQAKTLNLAKQLHAYEVDLPFFVPFSLIYNYQGNLAALEQKIGEIIMLTYANQHVDLGFNGTSNTWDGSFLTLSEGWLALADRVIAAATDGANTAQSFSVAADVTLTTPLKIMDKAIALMAQYQRRYANKTNVIIMGTQDFESLEVAEVARNIYSQQVLTDGASYKYRGHEIIVVDYLDTSNMLYTPITNFIYGMVTQGQGGTRLQSLEVLKGMQHNLESAVDFDFVNYQPIIRVKP
jgi:hypothetical protein